MEPVELYCWFRIDNFSFCRYFAFMSRSYAEIADEALNLPQNQQLKLARILLENSEARGDSDAERIWEEEIERRIQLVDSGLANGRPFAEIVHEIDTRLEQ
jgi:hypothetical protein